jgi:UDP-N-acetylmuramoylalanine-D-glutamate ligase
MALPVAESLRGAHNVANVLAAADRISCRRHAATILRRCAFEAVPHRLETGEVDDVRYVNDRSHRRPSARLRGFAHRADRMLLGGKDRICRKMSWRGKRWALHGIVFFGADGPLLEAAFEANASAVSFEDARSRARRYAAEADEARDGGTGTSCCSRPHASDAYASFEERGEEFRQIVRRMAAGRLMAVTAHPSRLKVGSPTTDHGIGRRTRGAGRARGLQLELCARASNSATPAPCFGRWCSHAPAAARWS